MLDQEVINAAAPHAKRLGVSLASLLAVVETESAGAVFAVVGGRREPLIRFEGHYFDRRLSGDKRDQARRLGLSHPKAGAVKNPRDQAARWKLVMAAAEIDAEAAFESVSFGVGQVMGAHWKVLGFASVTALVNLARSGAGGQIELMARFIEQTGLQRALQRRDWAGFARGYNGPGYAANNYDRKMAAAERRYASAIGGTPASSAAGMLRLGSRGARVRELQQLLLRAGHAVSVDGNFGPATERALRKFQAEDELEQDGLAGPETMRALERFRQGPNDQPGKQALTEISEVRAGVIGGLGGSASLEAARSVIADASAQLSYLPGLEWVTTGLAIAAAGLAIGGLAYAAWGWWKSDETEEQPE